MVTGVGALIAAGTAASVPTKSLAVPRNADSPKKVKMIVMTKNTVATIAVYFRTCLLAPPKPNVSPMLEPITPLNPPPLPSCIRISATSEMQSTT